MQSFGMQNTSLHAYEPFFNMKSTASKLPNWLSTLVTDWDVRTVDGPAKQAVQAASTYRYTHL
jgi:hypothetical protein